MERKDGTGSVLAVFYHCSVFYSLNTVMDVCIPSSPLPNSTFPLMTRVWQGWNTRRTMYMESDLASIMQVLL